MAQQVGGGGGPVFRGGETREKDTAGGRTWGIAARRTFALTREDQGGHFPSCTQLGIPRRGKSQIARELKALLPNGGRRVVRHRTRIGDECTALKRFLEHERSGAPELQAWLKNIGPLTGIRQYARS